MKASLFERLRYWFDKVMARGLFSMIAFLLAITLGISFLASIVMVVFKIFPPETEFDLPTAMWTSLMNAMDTGALGADQGFNFRIVMAVVSLTGIILVSALIAAVATAFDEKLQLLKRGRSRVLEQGHTLILGWNDQIHQIISEIAVADESNKRSVIVVLADRDKVEMEEELKVGLPKHTKLIVRTGSPMVEGDLKMVQHDFARSIVILSPDNNEDADSFSIKTALAIVNSKHRKGGMYKVVGEIKDAANLEVAQLIGKDEISWIQAEEIISRLIVQTSRQNGLASVFADLLDFDGDELYLVDAGSNAGKTVEQVALSLQASSLIGLVRNGAPMLNAPATTKVTANDKLVILSEDDSTIAFGSAASVDSAAFSAKKLSVAKADKTLILGSNSTLEMVLKEINDFAAKGSQVTIVDSHPIELARKYPNVKIDLVRSEPTGRAALTKLNAGSYDHVIILSDRHNRTVEQADARTLLSLLTLRELTKGSKTNVNIVAEMLNDQNRELAESATGDDFIVSSKLIGNLTAQVAENPAIRPVLEELLGSSGQQVVVRPADYYVATDKPVSFNTVIAAALKRGDTALGYLLASNGSEAKLNPNRTDKVKFGAGDGIVVLTK